MKLVLDKAVKLIKVIIMKIWKEMFKDFMYIKLSILRFHSKGVELDIPGLTVDNDAFYIICPYGIGDILVGKMLANKMRNNKKKVVYIIRENYTSLNSLLESNEECIADTQLVKKIETNILYNRSFKGKNYVYGHFPKDKDGNLWRVNLNKYVWEDYCSYVYGTKKKALYHISKNIRSQRDLKNKHDIIICPHAYSYSTGGLTGIFWEELVEKLQQFGCTVYTNVAEMESEIVGTKRLECSLKEISEISDNFGAVIAARSGICDLLAIKSSVPLFVINGDKGVASYWNLEYLRANDIYNFVTTEDGLLTNIIDKLKIVL